MSNPAFKPSEGKREEFRKYLEKNGVMDALTKVLVNLYEEVEKPEDALGYLRDKLATQAGLETFDQMKARVEELQQKIEALEVELNEVKNAGASTGEDMDEPHQADVPDEEAEPKSDVPPEEAAPETVPDE